MHPAVICALLAALLFGGSAPFAKLVLGQAAPAMVAGLLYLGSGIGLGAWMCLRALRPRRETQQAIAARDLPWLAAVVLFGGVAGPLLLMLGLARIAPATASLLLNMESVFTALLAWFVFHEAFDRRIFIGMLAIVAAGLLLSWSPGAGLQFDSAALLVMGACLCWAVDNNFTRKISGNDAVQIACIKGLAAGSVNLAIAALAGLPWPTPAIAAQTAIIGFIGYGISLALAVVAMRGLGTARTGAYFSTAPFVGAALSLLMFADRPGWPFWLAAALMALGLWLHLSERHIHPHTHESMDHSHPHVHDAHHQHQHEFEWDGSEPHTHPHHHAPVTHTHEHYPDLHHRHRH
jgi:drug/metabolite transporter (DMT)-like permease